MAEWTDSTASSTAWAGGMPARFFKIAQSSDDEFGILEEERCIDTRCLPKTILASRAGVQQSPADWATNQLQHSDTSRLVRPEKGGSMRSRFAAGCWDSGRVCSTESAGASGLVG